MVLNHLIYTSSHNMEEERYFCFHKTLPLFLQINYTVGQEQCQNRVDIVKYLCILTSQNDYPKWPLIHA